MPTSTLFLFLQALDHAGMDIIERMDPAGFTTYLKQYGNTICGRHPIGVFLNMIAEIRAGMSNGYRMDLKFLKYAQSSQVRLIPTNAMPLVNPSPFGTHCWGTINLFFILFCTSNNFSTHYRCENLMNHQLATLLLLL